MKTAVIYARYSSDRQTEQSIEGQLHVCQEYAAKNNIVIVATYIDRAMTGTNDNRTDFQRMLKDSNKRAWNYVLVYKLDRFSRNKYEMAMHRKTLSDNGIKLISAMENIPDTPEGINLESLLEGMAEYYSAELSQKVKRGLRESRAKGNFTGGTVLFGYNVKNKKVVINEDEAKIIRYIYSEYAAGTYVKDIIANLTEKGLYYRGKPFARTTVYNILKNEKYGGITKHNDEIFTNIYPRIIPEDIFNIVRSKASENHYGKHTNEDVYLLKNKVFCGHCGKTVTSDSGTFKSGVTMRYYKCHGRKNGSKCSLPLIRKSLLEQIVMDATYKAFFDTTTVFDIADKVLELHNKRITDNSVITILENEKSRLNKSINNILTAIENGLTSISTQARLTELEDKLSSVQEKLAIEHAKLNTYLTRDDIIKFIKTSIKKSPSQLVRLLVKRVVLYDDRIEITYNYTNNQRPDDDDHRVFCFSHEKITHTIDQCKIGMPPLKLSFTIYLFI